ncbi:translation initiation factor IF-1 [Candidatus Sneabacter namystus]|uniref:Translation initiation factor IF-1 n=1 Tax=Candidatus Sneabacter namystus TaxID=2601646 RepID=A0A5C0UJ20_9RICK|nr:translation initiation factor IF-1 [Candidatus Sneabacter namystus]QEK39452.1 translation initiation factor IF-1 [Candidatus Sneabacter namystus]
MPKEDFVECLGDVVTVLPCGKFKVEIELRDLNSKAPEDAKHTVIAHSAGRIKQNRIRIIMGDKVTVVITKYDLAKGRIIKIHKKKKVPFVQ